MTTGRATTSSTRSRWVARPRPRDWLLAGLVLVSALLYFPLNHGPHGAHILTTSIDRSLPVVAPFAIPYIAFLPIFWLTVAFAFVTGRRFVIFAVAVASVYLVSDLVFALYPTFAPRPHHIDGFLSGSVRYVYRHDEPYND